jgi:hypothetical protein
MSVAFAMNVFKDKHLGEVCKASLREFHPDDPFFVIPDEPRLKLPKFGGLWTKRYLEMLVQTGCDHLIKIDPDQRVRGKMDGFPDADLFGELFEKGAGSPAPGVYGYCKGWSLSAARRMLEANLWEDPKYKQEDMWWSYRKEYSEELVSLQDPIVGDISLRLGMTLAPWKPNLWR